MINCTAVPWSNMEIDATGLAIVDTLELLLVSFPAANTVTLLFTVTRQMLVSGRWLMV